MKYYSLNQKINTAINFIELIDHLFNHWSAGQAANHWVIQLFVYCLNPSPLWITILV